MIGAPSVIVSLISATGPPVIFRAPSSDGWAKYSTPQMPKATTGF